jgi:peptide/nickel transport system substrate-binding protein
VRRIAAIVALVLGVAVGVGAERAPGTTARQGGTLRVVLGGDRGGAPFDPALMPTEWHPLWHPTCATLTAFRDAPAPGGFQVEPEAAAGPPVVSRDGRTYTFTIRPGLRFNDGSPVRAVNFAHALDRVLNPAMRAEGAAAELYTDVKRVWPSRGGRLLHIELTRPSGDLLMRLALAYACPVPLGFPVDPAGVELNFGSGPYYLASHEPGKRIVLERNPYYRGSRPHWVDRVEFTIGGDIDANIKAVAEDRADVVLIQGPFTDDLARRYGVNKGQYFQISGAAIQEIVMNTSRPLFRGNSALRRAVNFAIDRPAIMRARDRPATYRPTDQILTHWMPGWVDHRLYPLMGPNLPRAKSLAEGHVRSGKAVLYTSPGNLDAANVIVRNLREIGLDVEVKTLSDAVINARVSTPGEPYDMGLWANGLDYPDPASLIIRLLGGENARKPTGNLNHAYFDVPAYNKRMRAADRLAGAARARAFSKLEADIMRNEAPWAPLWEGVTGVFVSTSVGCLKAHPAWGMDLAAICLR